MDIGHLYLSKSSCSVTKFAQIDKQHLTGEAEFCKGSFDSIR